MSSTPFSYNFLFHQSFKWSLLFATVGSLRILYFCNRFLSFIFIISRRYLALIDNSDANPVGLRRRETLHSWKSMAFWHELAQNIWYEAKIPWKCNAFYFLLLPLLHHPILQLFEGNYSCGDFRQIVSRNLLEKIIKHTYLKKVVSPTD